MIALLQRVTHASVTVDNQIIGEIGKGILVFLAVEPNDSEKQADRLVERILGYRIFCDSSDKMNLNVQEVNGGLLLVPQFTLAADTKKGMRPSFTSAANPELGKRLFDYFVNSVETRFIASPDSAKSIQTGRFGADMQVNLCNDGPATFWLCA